MTAVKHSVSMKPWIVHRIGNTKALKTEISKIVANNAHDQAEVKFKMDGDVLTLAVATDNETRRVDTFVKHGRFDCTQKTSWFRKDALMRSREKRYRVRGGLSTIFENVLQT